MIADAWSSFAAELTAALLTWGVLAAAAVLAGSVVYLFGYRRGRLDQARWAVGFAAAQAQVAAEGREPAETVALPTSVAVLVPGQRQPS